MHFAGSVVVPESVADPLKYGNNTANSLGSPFRRSTLTSRALADDPLP
jgi:hypothetical protein